MYQMKKILVVIIFLLLVTSRWSLVNAGECSQPASSDDENALKTKIEECTKLLQMSVSATKPHEQVAISLEKDIAAIEANIKSLDQQIEKKKASIAINEQKFAVRQKNLDLQTRDFYKKNWTSPMEYLLVTVLGGEEAGDALNLLAYRQSLMNRDKQTITSLVVELSELQEKKKQLEENQEWLATKQVSLATTLAPIKKLVNESKAYQTQLNQTVGSLSARQQELIGVKIGSLNLSRSAGMTMACSDDRKIDPGFSPRFAFYTFGIPHRVGMSQFGAYGRANANQGYQDILRAYFNGINFEKKSNINISVQGYSSMPIEQYMLGIYEVPDSWPMAALKAQAVAARSYAWAYTNGGANSICTTQSCQVYKGGNKGGNWERAVKETEGEVMTNGGQVIKAWYSSTDGGYTHTSADVPSFGGATSWTKNTRDVNGDINNINDLFSKAYDRDSPCFYNAQGWRAQYNKSAWLKSEEVADIVNVIMLSADNNMIDTWSADKVKSTLGGRAFSRIDSVSMEFDLSYGKTTWVIISGDAGTQRIDGANFKNYFNLRAPANIAIVGPLFNIEKQ